MSRRQKHEAAARRRTAQLAREAERIADLTHIRELRERWGYAGRDLQSERGRDLVHQRHRYRRVHGPQFGRVSAYRPSHRGGGGFGRHLAALSMLLLAVGVDLDTDPRTGDRR